MNHSLKSAALALVLLPLTAEAGAAQNPPPQKIDAIFTEFDHSGSVGCAVGVARNGEFVYKKGYGYANLDWDIPITPSTVFYMGSVSKQFTATAIALLAHEGKLSLDDDIRKYLPGMPRRDPPVTIRQVVHHMSGVPDMYRVMRQNGLSTWDRFSRLEALELLAKQELDFAPGEKYQYSNGGYFLLSMVVERASGKSLREYTTEKIFQPLGMNDTHFHDDPVHIVKHRAMSYGTREEGEQGVEGKYYQSYQGNFVLPGAGGLYSTVEDLLQWDRNYLSNQLGGSDLMDLVHTKGVLNSGEELSYAFAIREGEHRGLTTWGHSGSFMGFKTSYVRYPEQRFSVWVLCNMGEIVPANYGRQVAELFLEKEMAAVEEGRQSSSQL
ncbi:MAG: serine hydrolase [Gemmatimonadetes bacterium]|nr:serine hydrolase [Gemmatimonadota bacterium]